MSEPTGYIKGEFKERPARRRDRAKLWIIRHQEAIILTGVGTFVVVGGYWVIKLDMKYQARAREAEAKLIAALNKTIEAERQIMPIYPIPPAA